MRYLLLLILGSFFIQCGRVSTQNHASSEHLDHWSYQGETSPEHWKELEIGSDCEGKLQSPINIVHVNTEQLENNNRLEVFYSPKTILDHVENNGHSIQFDFQKGDSISFDGKVFYLQQIHFHESSEHKINGVQYPLEVHLVHLSSDREITVLGIMGVEGEESQLFEFFESFLPLESGESKLINSAVDLSLLFPKSLEYYSYEGSLTTPPCSENVHWVVFKNPIILSLEEVLQLKKYMPLNNYRNEQPLNNRTVFYSSN